MNVFIFFSQSKYLYMDTGQYCDRKTTKQARSALSTDCSCGGFRMPSEREQVTTGLEISVLPLPPQQKIYV